VVLIVIVIAAAAVLPAAPTCLSNTTLDALVALGSSGCQSQDKIFSNFSYTPLTGGVTSTHVTSSIVLTQGGSGDIHGWLFSADTGTWTTGFSIGFDIAVAPGFPGLAIIGSKDQINTGFVPNGVTMADTQSVGTLSLTGATLATESQQIAYGGVQSVTSRSVIGIASGSELLSFEQDFRETGIPEPMSFVLIGTGLLGLGLMRRRARR
jgi:hypothetical protein